MASMDGLQIIQEGTNILVSNKRENMDTIQTYYNDCIQVDHNPELAKINQISEWRRHIEELKFISSRRDEDDPYAGVEIFTWDGRAQRESELPKYRYVATFIAYGHREFVWFKHWWEVARFMVTHGRALVFM